MVIFNIYIYIYLYILSVFSFTDTDDLWDGKGREGTIFHSALPLLPAHEHWDIYLQLCMWDDYHAFLIATLVFTRLLLDEIYHLIELPFIARLMMQCLFVYLKNLFYAFVTAISHRKPVDLNSHRLLLLYYKRTD